jgi:hypothetical protein
VRIRPWRFTGEIDDVDFGETLPQFTRALLEVHVERVPFTVLDDAELPPEFPELDRYVTYPGYAPGGEVTSETNYIQSPGAILNYTTPDGTTAPAGVPIPYNIGITESLLRKRATWRRVPADIWGPDKPLTQMIFGDGTPGSRGYIGSLNKVTLFGHPPLTLKLEAVEEKQMADATGLGEVVDITYVWSYKPTPYGHLGYYYYGTSDPTNINGYYQVLARTEGQQTLAVADIDDDSSAFHVRDHRNLFLPGGA